MSLGAITLLVACCGCGGHRDATDSAPPIPECDAYVAGLAACLSRLDPSARASAEQRVAATRAALKPTGDEAVRARTAASCTLALERLKTSCPVTP